VVEQAVWLVEHDCIELEHLPEAVRAGQLIGAIQERRRQVADQLFEALVAGHCSFWEHVYPMFMERDLTRHDLRELLRRGLAATSGNYRAVLKLFGMDANDYCRFHNFLNGQGCKIEYREFRNGRAPRAVRPPQIVPTLETEQPAQAVPRPRKRAG
jgi:hypothetical protein